MRIGFILLLGALLLGCDGEQPPRDASGQELPTDKDGTKLTRDEVPPPPIREKHP